MPRLRNLTGTLVLLATLALTGCGFHSVYGAHGGADADSPVADQLNQVAIDSISERNGQMMRNDLIDGLYTKGRPAHPAYYLKVTLRPTEEDLGIQADATTTRTMVNMYADYVLRDAAGKELMRGTAHSVSNFNKIADQYATLAAREDVYARTINEASEQIVGHIALYFREPVHPPVTPAAPTPVPETVNLNPSNYPVTPSPNTPSPESMPGSFH